MILHTRRIGRNGPTAHALLYAPVMRKLLAIALSLPTVACVVGSDPGAGGGGGGGGGDGADANGGGGGGTAGHITQNTTWTGSVNVDVPTTVDVGVTLTVAAGTTVTVKSGASITLKGVMDVQGTSAAKVTIASPTAAESHGGISVQAGGELKMHYGVQSGGGIFLSGTGKATIVDTKLSNPGGPSTRGDFLVMSGGVLDMSYSEIGLATGDGTHCNFHFGGDGNTISVTHSTIRGVPYGLMFYGGTGSIFTNNNWESAINVDTQPGVMGDFTGSYFQGGTPVAGAGAQLTLTGLSNAPLADAGPRP